MCEIQPEKARIRGRREFGKSLCKDSWDCLGHSVGEGLAKGKAGDPEHRDLRTPERKNGLYLVATGNHWKILIRGET